MSLLSRFATASLLSAVMLPLAHAAVPRVDARPQVRVTNKVDDTKRAVLAKSTPAIVSVATDQGRLASDTTIHRMILVLKSSDAQEYALRSLLDEQQDKGSSNYKQWMTPEAFGSAFGVASADISKVTIWLQSSGFSVDSISAGGRSIVFTGTSGQVESAFRTEMHRITVNGEAHITNTVDLSVPEALAPVMSGIATLNDFTYKPKAVSPHKLVMGTDGQFHPVLPGTNTPDYTSLSSGSHYVAPADVAAIYNAKPLLATGIDGTGVSIGVIGQTSINLSNVETFRSMFNLPANDPTIVNVGPAPATIADDIESDLDVEWAGALATKAAVKFYTASGSLLDGGVDTAALAAVDSNAVDIISLSYGGCELSNAAAGTAYWNTLWEQAAAQGQTVFVSTGDSNATGCASSSATLATGSTAGSYAVNALGSSAYNVAVGGSMFNEGTATGVTSYWGPGGVAPFGTALSYIPEAVWNEGAFDIVAQSSGVGGGGGGVSIFTARPSWQVGPGITAADPAGPTFTASGAIPATQLHRLVPDVALIAAGNHDGTIFCSEGSCKLDSTGAVAGIGVVGGTSVATPVMAGVQALINQKNGGRQGNANYFYYQLAAAQTTASCASTLPPAATCNFNDIVTGSNYSPKTANGKYTVATGTMSGTLGTDYIGFPALTGYDTASGLGTPNISNLANNWKSVVFNASKTTLTLTPTTITHGTTQTAVITVAPVSTTNTTTPSGDVSIIAVGQSAGAGDGTVYKLSGGTVSASISSLPGGTYSVVAHYGGDGVFGASDSAPVTVTVSKEASSTQVASYSITTAGAVNSATTFAYGASTYIDAEVIGASTTGYTSNGSVPNTGAPTGTIKFDVLSGSTALPSYTSTLDAYGTTYLEIGQTFTNFLIYPNYPAIAPGPYTINTTYSGDNSFSGSTGTVGITVVKASVAPVLRAASVEIASGDTATFNVTIAASGGGVLPTGTVTVTDNTTSTVLGTGTLVNGAVVISSTGITTSGGHSIVASFSGDSNYNATNSTAATVTVGGTASSLTLASNATTPSVLTSITFTATPPTTATGTVYFYDGSATIGSAAISTTTHLATLAVATLTAGTHSITATYAGNTTTQSSTSNALSITVAQNTPTLSLTSQQANVGNTTPSMNAVLSLSPVNAAVANPAPSVPIQFLDGTTSLGTAPLTYTLNYHTYAAAFTSPVLKPGLHKLTAFFPGDTNYAAATSAVQNVGIGLTTTTLTSSTLNVGTNISFTLTATVAAIIPSTPTLTGTVTFYDGATAIGTGTVTAGKATLTTTLTSAAVHTITAIYSGDTNYATSTSSAAVNVTAVVPGYSVAVNPSSLTLVHGASGALTLTITSFGNYSGQALINITGLPANASYILPTSPITMNGVNSTQNITMYITTSSGTATQSGLFWLPAFLLAGLLFLRRKTLSTKLYRLAVVGIVFFAAMGVTGCSNGGKVIPATPAGTSTATVTVSGTGSNAASPNIAPTASVTLIVQ